jgi:hypothetical protein
MHAFLSAWNDAFAAVRSSGVRDSTALFVRSAERLGDRVPGVSCDATRLGAGALLWQPPGGVPASHGCAL